MAIGLVAECAGGDHKVDPHSKEDKDETSPGDQALGSKLVGVTAVRPSVGGVDGGVSIDVGSVLVLEPVDSITLQRKVGW